MTPKRFMIVAGEPSGDMLAAELVRELRRQSAAHDTYSSARQPLESDLAPEFFGAGGPRMAEAGVKLEFDLTQHSVVGLTAVLKKYRTFKKFLDRLVALAVERLPDVIVCVDFSGFNRRLASAIRKRAREGTGKFHNWSPRIVQYISPQVWASREGRIYEMERAYDMVLSIFPFEKGWYARRVPRLRVEYVGHPLKGRYWGIPRSEGLASPHADPIRLVLLPGSRRSELIRHLPVMMEAFRQVHAQLPAARATLVLPNEALVEISKSAMEDFPIKTPGIVKTQIGGLAKVLENAHLAIASTGTVTMECAYFGVPAVTLYKGSWIEYQIAKRLIRVKWLTMPNILADEPLFPEFLQNEATAGNISKASLAFLQDVKRIADVREKLARLMESLGPPGAAARAAKLILGMLH